MSVECRCENDGRARMPIACPVHTPGFVAPATIEVSREYLELVLSEVKWVRMHGAQGRRLGCQCADCGSARHIYVETCELLGVEVEAV